MSKPAKITLGSIAVLLVLIVIAVVIVGSRLDSIFANLIEHAGSEVTGTAVRVEGADLQPQEGLARVTGLTVANPPGYQSDRAIVLSSVQASVDPGSFTSDVVEVREVVVEDARIHLEQRGTGNNLQEILANIRANMPEGDAQPRDEGKQVAIDTFRLTGATLTASVPQLGESREISLSEIVVRDIGTQSDGATAAQVAAQILEPVLSRALEATAREILRGEDAAQGLLDRLNESF